MQGLIAIAVSLSPSTLRLALLLTVLSIQLVKVHPELRDRYVRQWPVSVIMRQVFTNLKRNARRSAPLHLLGATYTTHF